MKTKAKGVTLIELIIALSLTVIVLGIAFTFFNASSKTLKITELNSKLQQEGEAIEGELLLIGTQSEGIKEINGLEISDSSKGEYINILSEDGTVEVEELMFKHELETYLLVKENNTLTIKRFEEDGQEVLKDRYPKVLSENIKSIKIRPIDFRMKENGSFYDCSGIEISLILEEKIVYVEASIPVSVIVKFRNKA